jgi:methionyl-tRNA formyltransferase
MRIIFMGTPDFAVPCLDALVEAGHDILCVVAQPDKPKGRGKKLVSPPTIQRARALGIPTKQPKRVRRGPFVEWVQQSNADLAVVVAYGRILRKNLLEAPRLGCINVHASLLPKYRGAAPIHWAVINGESKTGVCTMQMDIGMDTGDVLLKRETPIGPEENTGILWDRLSKMGAKLLIKTIEQLDTISPTQQLHDEATYAPMLEKKDGRIDWNQSAEAICNRIRGVNPNPGAHTIFRKKPLKIWSALPTEGSGKPGSIIIAKKKVIVATGSGAIELKEVQLPGKKRGPAQNLINGARITVGETLGTE